VKGRRPQRGLFWGGILLVFVCACQKKSDKVCDWSQSKGLNVQGWTGEKLGQKELSLVFLKGPSEYTADISTLLQQQSIQASFFVQGAQVEEHEAVLAEISSEEAGHLIGNGGYRFRNLTEAKEPVLELRTTDALISDFVRGSRFLFYAPEKAFSQNIATQLKYNGLAKYVGPIKDDTTPSENFRYDEECWAQGMSVAACTLQYEAEIQRLGRGIIAFHDTSEQTLNLLETLLPALQTSGYVFKRLDEVTAIAAVLPAAGLAAETSSAKSCQDYE
jgi:peptidoglycan/xylan/chitin deacetylase (PgdA/CDA1 family)